ncbi:MAG TPA: hypothetical protein VJR71_00365 [Pseudolabrys sp.]|nr:hypothetical protein [Pseudolabrys sp.]
MSDDRPYLDILERVGFVLLVAGMLDIGVMIYCIMNAMAYSSSFNIFAVVLGVLLIRGNIWAASIVRFFGAFFLAGGLALVGFLPFLQPMSLTLAELRNTSPFGLAFPAALLAMCLWAALELNRDPVLAAFSASDRNISPLIFPLALGVGLVSAISGVIIFT